VLEDIDPYDRQEISFFSIPHGSVADVILGCVNFPGSESIECELANGLTGTPNEYNAPKVVVVGSARGGKISHTSSFQFCPCEGGSFNNFGPCYDYDPEVLKLVQMAGLIPAQKDDESDDQGSETSEENVFDSSEIEDLIHDEENYIYFVENKCGEKYGVEHEGWLGTDYFRRRTSL
jgi:hypothetical protein